MRTEFRQQSSHHFGPPHEFLYFIFVVEYVSLACYWVDPVSIAKPSVLALVTNMCSGKAFLFVVLLLLVFLRFALSKLR